MPLWVSAVESCDLDAKEGRDWLHLIGRFAAWKISQSISVTLAELSTYGADYVSMEGYGFFRRNLVPTTRNGTVTKSTRHPSLGSHSGYRVHCRHLGAGLTARPAGVSFSEHLIQNASMYQAMVDACVANNLTAQHCLGSTAGDVAGAMSKAVEAVGL